MSLPIGEAFSIEDLEQRFEVLEVRPARNPTCAFQLRVPRDWRPHHVEQMDREIGTEALTPLGGWQGPGPEDDSPPIFHVQAIRLEREISAKNYLLLIAQRQEMTGHFLRELSPAFCDSLLQQPIEGQAFLERVAVGIDGDRAFVLTGVAHPRRYLELEQTFGAMVGSFRILTPSPKRSVERWDEERLVPGGVRFQHPASFRAQLLEGSSETRAVVTMFGFDTDDRVTGLLHVESCVGPPLAIEAEHARLLEVCRASNVVPSGKPEEMGLDVEAGRFRAIGSRRYPAIVEGNDLEHEIWITILASDDAVLRVWMTTPGKQSSFVHWASNRRALEIVLGTLR